MDSNKYWEPEVETLPRAKLEDLQLERLRHTLSNVYTNVEFYRKRMDDAGIAPGSFNSLDELENFPFTVKDDLRLNYPFGLFARSMKDVVRLHSSSGTTGNPTVVGYTKNDIGMWANLIARQLYSTGARQDDIIQNSYGYGLFTGGLGLHYGGELLGAVVLPVSGGNTEGSSRACPSARPLGHRRQRFSWRPPFRRYRPRSGYAPDTLGTVHQGACLWAAPLDTRCGLRPS